ncbi:MAG: hypothetical protein ABW049_09745 [Spongiibacteraceae bacterium]
MNIHCPLCDTTAVTGQGLVLLEGAPLVQYHCQTCGELFFLPDRRNLTSPQEEEQ